MKKFNFLDEINKVNQIIEKENKLVNDSENE